MSKDKHLRMTQLIEGIFADRGTLSCQCIVKCSSKSFVFHIGSFDSKFVTSQLKLKTLSQLYRDVFFGKNVTVNFVRGN